MKITSASSSQTYLAALALAVGASLWGASFLLSKYALTELSVLHVVMFRFVIGTLFLSPVLLIKRVPLEKIDIKTAFFTGLFIAVTILLQVAGVSFTTAASAALITGIFPPLLALVASRVYNERLGARGWLAVAASTIGVVLLIGGPGAGRAVLGDGLVLLSVFAGVTWTLLAKRMSNLLISRTSTFRVGNVPYHNSLWFKSDEHAIRVGKCSSKAFVPYTFVVSQVAA